MSKIKVILQPSFGLFKATPEFQKLIESKGHESLWTLEARTDKDLISYIENNNEGGILLGVDDWVSVKVFEVDISKPWFISNYDGQEYIGYVEYQFINKELNYVELI